TLVAAERAHPGGERLQRATHRVHLPDVAAPIGIGLVERSRIVRGCEGPHLEAEAFGEKVLELERLGEVEAGVDEEDRDPPVDLAQQVGEDDAAAGEADAERHLARKRLERPFENAPRVQRVEAARVLGDRLGCDQRGLVLSTHEPSPISAYRNTKPGPHPRGGAGPVPKAGGGESLGWLDLAARRCARTSPAPEG